MPTPSPVGSHSPRASGRDGGADRRAGHAEQLRAVEEELTRVRCTMEAERESCRGFEIKLAERRAQA